MKRFVVLLFTAMLVSYCGTPPPAGTVLDDAVTSEEEATDADATQTLKVDKKTAKIAAVTTGVAVALCYTVPKVSSKMKAKNLNCRGLVKDGAHRASSTLKSIGTKIAATGRSIGQKVKNLTKRSAKTADEADSAAKSTDDATS